MLNPLQLQINSILTELPEARDFALAGGAALILRRDVDRLTRDLDYFATEPGQVDRLRPSAIAALSGAGLTIIEEQVAAGFVRLTVANGESETGVDLASDARLFPAEPSPYGPILSAEELAVDKVLAVFGRAEARDFIDLTALEPRFGLASLCTLAIEKDAGFSAELLRGAIKRFERLQRDEFDVDDDTFRSVAEAVLRWCDILDEET